MNVPSAYMAGYEKARLIDKETADNYIAHTHIGDPVMDAIVVELAPLPQDRVHRYIQARMDVLGRGHWYLPSWLQWLPKLRVESDEG